MNRSALCLASALFLTLAGCSSMKTTEVTLDPVRYRAVPEGREVVIDSVTDERTLASLPKESRVGAAGATRGAHAPVGLGNAVASDGSAQFVLGGAASVPDWVRGMVVAGLARTGYRVVSAQAASPQAVHLDVGIQRLWAWKPVDGEKSRTWAKQMKSVVETTVTVKGQSPVTLTVATEAVHPLQVFNEENVDISYRLIAANYVRVFQQQAQGKL